MIPAGKLTEIIKTWELEVLQTNIFPREIMPFLREQFVKQVPMVLHGIRRSGKTYLMYQLMQESPGSVYVNFEDERFSGSGSEILDELYSVYIGTYIPERPVMFLDEVQNIPGWEKFVSRLYTKVKFVISGSNATLLSSEYSTALTGRHVPIRIYPLSFSEFLTASGIVKPDPDITETRARIRALLADYFEFGGFPQASLMKDKFLLKSTFDSIIFRDVIPRFSIQNPAGIEALARYLVSNPGKPVSFRKLTPIANVRHEDTVKSYVEYLEKAYLFNILPRFDYSIRKQAVNLKKIYPADTSFTRHSGSLFSEDRGRLLETVVSNEFRRKGKDLFYWKDVREREVDFVVCEGLKPLSLIQVCERIEDEKVLKRETAALLLAGDELAVKDLILLTEAVPALPVPNGIRVVSVLDWLIK
ncbi:MAG: ATP-binding protein [Bacteroidales bacterium]|nr:ATP-binding protein [Bacteroidales bacterium]